MSNKRPRRDFDLPNRHINGQTFFVPPKARTPEEIVRRAGQPRGTLLAEYQCRGLAMATIIVGLVKEPTDISSASSFISPAGINMSWHSFAEASEVMRRRLKLPRLDADDPEMRPTSHMLRADSIETFGQAAEKGYRLVEAFRSHRFDDVEEYSKQVGRMTGSAALILDCVEIGDQIGYDEVYMTDFEVQDWARRRGMGVLERARTMQTEIGHAPSIASLADPDSGLSVNLRRNATNAVVEAYEEAYESTQLAAA